MYCSCLRPSPVQNTANGEKFTVCSTSKGGCGLEIETLPDGQIIPNIITKNTSKNIELEYTCINCSGTGISSRDLITCYHCKGTGISIL